MKLLYGNCTVRYNARSVRFRLIRLIGTRVWIYKINLYFQLSGFISCRIFDIYGHAISSIGSPFPIDEEFVIRIEDDNGVYDFNGRIALCERFEYATEAVHDAEGALKADFTLMKLEEGRNAFVSLIDKTTGEILYTANLVDDILMFRGDAGEPPYSLECDHDFPITLKLKYEKETWMLIQATVLDWNVVSRPIELEN